MSWLQTYAIEGTVSDLFESFGLHEFNTVDFTNMCVEFDKLCIYSHIIWTSICSNAW